MGINFLDLFAGAGGLSEGFIKSGYTPISHVEMDKGACYTLKTRLAFHWLKSQKKEFIYHSYLSGQITRNELYSEIPLSIIGSVLNEEINKESLPRIFNAVDSNLKGKKLDLIVGGPPCQAYSIVGRSRDKNGMQGDKRNYLYSFYAEFLEKYQPSYFVFENVLGLLSAKDKHGIFYFDKMKKKFNDCGYVVEHKIIDASEYGIPQKRKRVILIGKRGSSTDFYPKILKSEIEVPVLEVIKDLPKIKSGQGTHKLQPINPISPNSYLYQSGIRCTKNNHVTWHQARPHIHRDLEIYNIAISEWNKNKTRLNYNHLPNNLKTHKNRKSFLDRFKVVANEKASHTIVAHISKDGHYYIHPDKTQNRSLTVREAARIQTFPDDYYFESHSGKPSRTAAFKQIGNAVPTLLAQQISLALIEKF